MNVGNKIKILRIKLGLSNRQLAFKTKLSQPVMNRIENNERKVDIKTLERICTALNITLADFFAPTGEGVEPLSPELHRLLESAKSLSPDQLKLAQRLLDEMAKK